MRLNYKNCPRYLRSLNKLILCVAVASFSVSCSKGFNRTGLKDQLSSSPYTFEVAKVGAASDGKTGGEITAEDIAKARAKKPQLKFPFSLAVYADGFSLAKMDKDLLSEWQTKLQNRGVVTNIFPLSKIGMRSTSQYSSPALTELRLAAAEQGADALLVVRAAYDTDSYVNPFSLFYLTLIGYFIVPGSNLDILAMLDSAVIDVGNGYVYATAQAEGQASRTRPGAYMNSDAMKDIAAEKALKALGENLVERLTALK